MKEARKTGPPVQFAILGETPDFAESGHVEVEAKERVLRAIATNIGSAPTTKRNRSNAFDSGGAVPLFRTWRGSKDFLKQRCGRNFYRPLRRRLAEVQRRAHSRRDGHWCSKRLR